MRHARYARVCSEVSSSCFRLDCQSAGERMAVATRKSLVLSDRGDRCSIDRRARQYSLVGIHCRAERDLAFLRRSPGDLSCRGPAIGKNVKPAEVARARNIGVPRQGRRMSHACDKPPLAVRSKVPRARQTYAAGLQPAASNVETVGRRKGRASRAASLPRPSRGRRGASPRRPAATFERPCGISSSATRSPVRPSGG